MAFKCRCTRTSRPPPHSLDPIRARALTAQNATRGACPLLPPHMRSARRNVLLTLCMGREPLVHGPLWRSHFFFLSDAALVACRYMHKGMHTRETAAKPAIESSTSEKSPLLDDFEAHAFQKKQREKPAMTARAMGMVRLMCQVCEGLPSGVRAGGAPPASNKLVKRAAAVLPPILSANSPGGR